MDSLNWDWEGTKYSEKQYPSVKRAISYRKKKHWDTANSDLAKSYLSCCKQIPRGQENSDPFQKASAQP